MLLFLCVVSTGLLVNTAEPIGCEKCHYHGTCYSRGDDQIMCECFQWYAGENCQINLKGKIKRS
jgi:hypothetical protein